jgi:hypothetical protein
MGLLYLILWIVIGFVIVELLIIVTVCSIPPTPRKGTQPSRVNERRHP